MKLSIVKFTQLSNVKVYKTDVVLHHLIKSKIIKPFQASNVIIYKLMLFQSN